MSIHSSYNPFSDCSLRQHPAYELPHALHLPTDSEVIQTRAKVAEREAQIKVLKAKIADLTAALRRDASVPTLRALMDDTYHPTLAEEVMTYSPMAFREAEAVVEAKVADLNAQLRILQQENSRAAGFIPCFPVEILAEIFHLCTDWRGDSLFVLTRVCRAWHGILLAMPNIWKHVLRLATGTPVDKVRFLLERRGIQSLDVEINTDLDERERDHFDIIGSQRYAGLALAADAADRWRHLTITTFATAGRYRQVIKFRGPMDALESLRITNLCESGVVFNQLLDVVGSSSHSKIKHMELMSPNAFYYFAQPQSISIFHRLHTFKADGGHMQSEVDILPSFQNLEDLDIRRVRLPWYSVETDLPLIRTLKRIKLDRSSVGWMAHREFSNVAECTIIRPQDLDAIYQGFSLSACTHFTYDGLRPYMLSYVNLPHLISLYVKNDVWSPRQGSRDLATMWTTHLSQWKRIKVLHLDTQCYDESLVLMLSTLRCLEELELGVKRPTGLGRMFFMSLMATRSKSSRWNVRLCPGLQRLRLRYRRWIRNGEEDKVTGLLVQIGVSRRKTSMPLRNLHIWLGTDDAEGIDLNWFVVELLCREKWY